MARIVIVEREHSLELKPPLPITLRHPVLVHTPGLSDVFRATAPASPGRERRAGPCQKRRGVATQAHGVAGRGEHGFPHNRCPKNEPRKRGFRGFPSQIRMTELLFAGARLNLAIDAASSLRAADSLARGLRETGPVAAVFEVCEALPGADGTALRGSLAST